MHVAKQKRDGWIRCLRLGLLLETFLVRPLAEPLAELLQEILGVFLQVPEQILRCHLQLRQPWLVLLQLSGRPRLQLVQRSTLLHSQVQQSRLQLPLPRHSGWLR